MSLITTKSYQVRANECDLRSQATLATLVTYLNEAAWESARSLGVPVERLIKNGLTWVMHRLRLEIDAFPRHRDRVTVDTWPSGKDRFFAYRDYEIKDENGRSLARATSTWPVVDIEKRRLVPMPDWIKSIAVETERIALPRASGKLPVPERYAFQQPIRTLWHHLDINRHVSNAHYFPFVLEALPFDFLEKHQIREIDLVLKAECGAGEDLLSMAEAIEPQAFLHRLSDSQGKELVQARTRWR